MWVGSRTAAFSLVIALGATFLSSERAFAQAYPAPGSFTHEPGFSMTFRSVYHAYQVRLYTAPVVMSSTITGTSRTYIDEFRNVNPLYMTIDAGGWSVGPNGDFDAVVSLRYNTDFGTGFGRETPNGYGIPAVDGRNDFDLMLMYVDWRNVIQGTLDLRIGRQVLVDDLDWYSLDGVKATAHLARSATASVDLEAYVGMPVRIGRLFNSEPFINDGFEISDGPGLTFGGAVFAHLFHDLTLSAAYRQELVFRKDDLVLFRPVPLTQEEQAELAAVRAASAGKIGLEESLFGVSAGYTARPLDLDLFANMVFNLVFNKVDFVRGGVTYNPTRELHAKAEVLYVYPRFAADSIFNIFNIFPYTRGNLSFSYEILPGFTADAGYFILSVQGSPSTSGAGPSFKGEDIAHGPSLGLTYRTDRWIFGAYGEAGTNFGGKYAFGGNYRRAEVFGDASFLEHALGATLRLGLTTVQDDWYEKIDTGQVAPAQTSYTADIGVRASPWENVTLRLNYIKNFDSILEGSYRVLAVLELRY